MICPNCGTQTDDDARFCSSCGASLKEGQESCQTPDDGCTEENSAETGKHWFLHTSVGKVAAAAVAVCIAGAAAITGAAQYNANHPELLAVSDEPEGVEDSEDVFYDVNDLSEEQQSMIGPMGAWIYDYEDVGSDGEIIHSWTSTEENWGPLGDLINNFEYLYEDGDEKIGMDPDGSVKASEGFLKECASALYADFDGILPDIPSASEEVGIMQTEGDYYYFVTNDRGEDSMDFYINSWVSHADGSDTLVVEAYDHQGEFVSSYQFELVGNTYTEGLETPVFVYAVSDMTKLSDEFIEEDDFFEDDAWAGEDEDLDEAAEVDTWYEEDNEEDAAEDAAMDEYLLPESNSRYYTKKELSVYDQDQLRLARNEIYARHGRLFDAKDLQDYFDSQSWYYGAVKPEDFDESVFNKYEKANINTIRSLESKTQDFTIPDSAVSAPEISDQAVSDLTDTGSTTPESDDSNFEESWNLIQSYEMSTEGYDSRDSSDSRYFCTSLSFTVYGSTMVDKGSYYEVQAVFNKPVLVPRTMKAGDQYMTCTDELQGINAVFTGDKDIDGNFCLFEEGVQTESAYGWYGDFDGQDGYTEITGDDGYRLECPFYEGILRIRKDAVTGDLLNLNTPYTTVTVSDMEGRYDGEDYLWSNYTAFDEYGYVTELIYNGC